MRLNKPALRIMSTAAFLAIISSCAMPAFAGTYYLEDGNISVEHRDGEDYVSQKDNNGNFATGKDKDGNDFTINGTKSEKDIHGENDKDVTISNKNPDKETSNTITIENKDTADKSTAVRDIWAEEGDTRPGSEGKHKSDDSSAKVTLKDVNIVAKDGEAGISVKDSGGDVTIVLDETLNPDGSVGTNKVTGGAGHAGIEKNSDDSKGGTLVIREKIQGNGNLDVTGGAGTDDVGGSAGIGSAAGKNTNDILVINPGITAKGGDAVDGSDLNGGAGIGSGAGGNASDITIKNGRYDSQTGNSITGGSGVNGGAGIGSGGGGNADNIIIGNGAFDVTGGSGTANGGAGIGSGGNGNKSDVKISNIAREDIKGGDGGLNGGAGIGGGGGTGESNVNFDNGTVKGSITGGNGTGAGGNGGAGIGGGGSNMESTVSVKGGDFDKNSDFKEGSHITGGNGTANGGAGIGGGGGSNTTSKTEIANGYINSEIKGGSSTDPNGNGGAGIGGGGSNNSSTVDIKLDTNSFITNTTGGNGGAGIGGGSGNKTSDVTINMNIKDDADLDANDKNPYVSGAQGGNGGAGIGGGANNDTSTVTVKKGTINGAQGGENAAGIGTGANSKNGTVTIEKGDITADGGKNGAGIGGGANGSGEGNISISGGKVTATGGDNAYSIGSSKSNGGTHDVSITTKTDRTEVTAIARTNSQNAGDVIEGAATGKDTAVSFDKLGEDNSGVIYFKTLTGTDLNHFQTIHNMKFTLEGINEAKEIHPWTVYKRVEPTYDADGYIEYHCQVDGCLEILIVPLTDRPQRPDRDDDTPTTPTNPVDPTNPTKPGNYDTPASDPTVDDLPQQPGTLPDGGTTADTTSTTDATTDTSTASTTGAATADTAAADATAQEGGAAAAQTGAAAHHTASVPGALPQTGQNWLGALAAAFGGFGLLGFGLLSDKKRHFRSR